MKKISRLVLAVALASVMVAAEMLPIGRPLTMDCSRDDLSDAYIGNVTLQRPSEAVVARYEGTALFVDCFEFVVQRAVCDGVEVTSGLVNVSGRLQAESGAVSSTQPLSSDLLGASVLSTSYYYSRSQYVSLVFSLNSLGTLSGNCAVTLNYTFSIYTSRATSANIGGNETVAAPFVYALAPYVLQTQSRVSIRMLLPLNASVPHTAVVRTDTMFAVPFFYGSCNNVPTSIRTNGVMSYGTPSPSAYDGQWSERGVTMLEVNWTTRFSNSGVFILCMQPSASPSWLYAGLISVHGTNPAYFMTPMIPFGVSIHLNRAYILIFRGVNMNGVRDQAKLISLRSRSCATGTAAGGVPIANGFSTAEVTDEVVWNITVTIQGSYLVCYYTAATGKWSTVPWLAPLSVDSTELVKDTYGTVAPTPLSTTAAPNRPTTTTTTGAPVTTTTRAPNRTTTAAPNATTAPPIPTTTPAPTQNCVETLPSECLLIPAPLPPMGGYSSMRMVLTVTYTDTLPKWWVAELATLLCVEPSKIAVFEFAPSTTVSGAWDVVVGVQCLLTDSCSTSLTISTVNCAVNDGTQSLDTLQQALLTEVGVTGCSVRDSSFSTSNTTYHAASSSNALSPVEVAIVSSTAAVVGGAIAAAVVIAIVVWRRRQISERMRALHMRFFHPAVMFTDGAVRPGHGDVEPDFDGVISTVNGVVLEMHEEDTKKAKKNPLGDDDWMEQPFEGDGKHLSTAHQLEQSEAFDEREHGKAAADLHSPNFVPDYDDA